MYRDKRVLSLGALVVLALVLLWGIVTTPGMLRGHDMFVGSYAAYEARTGSWQSIWDDLRFPGTTKPTTRMTWTQFAVVGLTNALGDYTAAMRLLEGLLVFLALVAIYLLVLHFTNSHVAGVLAAVVYVFNRGAPFQGQLAFTAGYALTPLVFLALDRLLRQSRPINIAVFGVVLAAFVSSTILPFTYIVGLCAALYVAVFYLARLARAQGTKDLRAMLPTSAGLAAGLLVAALLCSYYIAGLVLSTAPTVSDKEGYSLEEVALRSVTLWEAITLKAAGGFLFDTPAMAATNLLIAITGFLWALVRRSYWLVACVLIAIASIFFASQVETPAYQLFFERVPLFSLVRIARRWEAVTLLTYAVMLGAAFKDAPTLLARAGQWASTRLPWRRVAAWTTGPRVAAAVAAALVALVGITALAHWQGQRHWFQTFAVPEEYTRLYTPLREESGDQVVAATPFLGPRVVDDVSLVSADYSKHLAPAVASKPLITGFRVGGLKVNEGLRALVESMDSPPLFQYDSLTLTDSQLDLVTRNWDNVFFEGSIRIVDSPDGTAIVGVVLRSESPTQGYAVEMDEAAREVRLVRRANLQRRSQVLDSAPLEIIPGRLYSVKVAAQGPQMRVYVDDTRLIAAVDTFWTRGFVMAESSSATTEFQGIMVSRLPEIVHLDQEMMKKLSLFNAEYVVSQPNTNAIEQRRLLSVQGLELLHQEEGAFVGRNVFNFPKVYAPRNVALAVADNSEALLDTLAGIEGFSFDSTLVLDYSDVAGAGLDEALGASQFLIFSSGPDVPEPPTALEERLASDWVQGMPVPVHLLDVKTSSFIAGRPPVVQMEDVSLANDAAEIIDKRWKVFVLQARLMLGPATTSEAYAGVKFTKFDPLNYYLLKLLPATDQIELSRVGGESTVVLGTTRATIQEGQWYRLRLAADEQQISVFLDDRPVLQALDSTLPRGTTELVASGLTADFTELKATNPSENPLEFSYLRDHGFGVGPADTAAGRELKVRYDPLIYITNSSVRVLAPGRYRLAFRVAGSEFDSASARIAGPERSQVRELTFTSGQPLGHVYTNRLTGETEAYTWITSDPVELTTATYSVEVQVKGAQPLTTAAVLYMEPPGLALDTPGKLFSIEGHPASLDFQKLNASRYSLSVNAPEGGFVVFKDTYHEDWQVSLRGTPLPHYRAYGLMNAFLVPPTGTDTMPAELAFTSQRAFDLGKQISLAGLIALVAGGSVPLLARRAGARAPIWRRLRPARRGQVAGAQARGRLGISVKGRYDGDV